MVITGKHEQIILISLLIQAIRFTDSGDPCDPCDPPPPSEKRNSAAPREASWDPRPCQLVTARSRTSNAQFFAAILRGLGIAGHGDTEEGGEATIAGFT